MLLLTLKGVSKAFGDFKAVSSIDMALYEGETVGLLGPNGAGKSTSISMISTLFKPTEGTILYRGEDISINPRIIQTELGYVPQEIALYEQLTGYENLHYFGRLYGLKGDRLKRQIDTISKVIGIDERLKDKVKTYSGGMKRRINIGVALMHDPKFIIMDEPTVGIDPQSRNHILETVKKLNELGITVLYTSHYMEEVSQLCNRIYIMDHGKVIAEGTQEALIQQAEIKEVIHIVFELGKRPSAEAFKNFVEIETFDFEDGEGVYLTSPLPANKLIGTLVGTFGDIVSFDVKTPDLEQVFLKLTGRGLRD